MWIDNLLSFSNEIQKKIPSLCLIISKENEAVNIFLKNFRGEIKKFHGENFQASHFSFETESFSFFPEPVLCFIQGIDKLSEEDRKIVLNYIKKPNPKITLLLTSQTQLFAKEVEKQGGLVLQISDEKIWQKKKRLELLLKQVSQEERYAFTSEAIQYLVELVGAEKDSLFLEYEKLKAYTFEKKEITISDVKALVTSRSLTSLWDLGESFFRKETLKSIEQAAKLLKEGHTLFAILASLRNQIKTFLEMQEAYQKGKEALLVKEFPFLKGGILTKKVESIKKVPSSKLKGALYLIFEAEIQGRSNGDPQFVLELFFGKYDALFATESARAG